MSLDDLSTEQQVGLVGAAAVIIGAFLPWFEVSILGTAVTETGMDRDGWLTIILAGIAALSIAFTDWDTSHQAVVLVSGAIVALLAAAYVVDPFIFGYEGPADQRQLAESAVSVGNGIYLTLIGGLLLVFAAVVSLNESATDGTGHTPTGD
ncbi:hypothetical protein RBH26_20565 [Natronolimnohabitans sp. A-GB9]|uniref:hypothetical protein n=1 Tax=Natronolimnohabitans sp. A-GB9 TaxID=3069757 RepID=UPI0027AE6CBD|nr:hypothetical protein [Natronolimnohabitans sp. A-GB9]MDQ2052838.1 hypothetical protein [Natronolimnohabitans sp. A-GB9]